MNEGFTVTTVKRTKSGEILATDLAIRDRKELLAAAAKFPGCTFSATQVPLWVGNIAHGC